MCTKNKEKELRNIFFPKKKSKKGKENMLREIDTCTALDPLQIYQIWVLGTPVIYLFFEMRL